MPSTAVIIINYGTAELAIAAVQSVLKFGLADVTVHLLDNASPGDDADAFARAQSDYDWGAQVILYLETHNHGFGRGNNIVLQKLVAQDVPPDRVLLLNPDARLENDVISRMGAFLDTHPDVGMVGAGITKPDGIPVTAAFRFPNIADTFAGQCSFGPISKLLRRWQVPLPAEHPTGQVDWVAGAAVMCQLEALRDVGFFDPVFFLYFEEVDLMRRANLIGWKTWYLPEARVIHVEGAATGVKGDRRNRRPAYWYHSWQYYHIKSHGRIGAIFAALSFLAGTICGHLIAKLRGKSIRSAENVIPDFWHYVVNPLLRAPSVKREPNL